MNSFVIHIDDSKYLEHIGKKGRSGRFPLGSGARPHQHDGLNQKSKNKTSENYKKNEKEVSKMNDQQLDKHVNRLRKQKEAKELSHFLVDKHAFDRPKPDSVFVKAGRRISETALTGAGLYALKSVISGEFDRKGLGDAVFRGGARKK